MRTAHHNILVGDFRVMVTSELEIARDDVDANILACPHKLTRVFVKIFQLELEQRHAPRATRNNNCGVSKRKCLYTSYMEEGG